MLATTIAILGLSSAGCGALHLVHLPGDLLEEVLHEPGTVSRREAPGAIESQLLRVSEERDRLDLVVDTEDPGNDPKLLARRCDAGDAPACARVGSILVHGLGEAKLGLALLERGCEAGEGAACERAAELRARNYGPVSDPERADRLRQLACAADPPGARSCHLAARRMLDRRGTPARLWWDRYFVLEDRGCGAGSAAACEALGSVFARGSELVPQDELLQRYYEGLAQFGSFAALTERSPLDFAGVPLRKQQILAELQQTLLEERAAGVLLPRSSRREVRQQRQQLQMRLCEPGDPPAVCRERVAREMRPRLEVSAEGVPCLHRCPPIGGAPEKRCLCECLQERGGCGLDPALLEACLASASARVAQPDGPRPSMNVR